MKGVPWWSGFVLLTLASCGGGNLQHMDATPYAQLIERPNGECPHSKIEQGLVNKHPEATVRVTITEITADKVVTTSQIPVKANQTVYLGCAVLPSGEDAARKILDVQFE